jgi:ABC-2 type transport system permease protein
MMGVLFIMPFTQLIILGYAASFEVKNLNIHIIDMDKSSFSRDLVSKFSASPYFKVKNISNSFKTAREDMRKGKVDVLMEIPVNFEKNLVNGEKINIYLSLDAVNGIKAGLGNAYANMIINDFNTGIITKNTGKEISLPIGITWSNWYNKLMVYSTFMVPGILVLLVTMIAIFLTAINIVREKEIGTIEQLNVTPIKKSHFIIGKLFPFLLIAFFELSLGLIIAKLVFNLHYEGSLILVYSFTLVYLFAVLGIGLFISTITETQQQAMFIAYFIFVIFILMSGLFTPIESMPGWAQKLTWFNPIKYFIEFMRMVLLKGSTFPDVKNHFIIIAIYGMIINILAIWNYRKISV